MTRGFLPNTDNDLLAWSAAFSANISADPEMYGLTAAAATQYQAAHAAFAAGMTACNPTIRCKGSTAAKNEARAALKRMARQLSSIVQGQAAVNDAQKIELGLTVRAAKRVIPQPGAAPAISIVSVFGTTVKIKLRDATSSATSGLPTDVSGASLFSFVGAVPPSDLSEWRFNCNTGRTRTTLVFGSDSPPGTKVWLTAFWFNGRKQNGPACPPVATNLPGGSVAMAA